MTLQAAAQGLVDRIADLGASPLDWSEYTALEKALEAAQAVEPVAWLVLDEDRVPIMCAPAKQMCNDHINDAINDFDITEASKWVVREVFTRPAPPPAGEPVARVAGVDEYGPRIDWFVHWAKLHGANLYAEPPAQQVAVPTTKPPCDFDMRGVLASKLMCWHRLTEAEAQDLICFFEKVSTAEAKQAHPVDAMKATPEDMLIYRNIAKQVQQVAVPAGMELVPIEPTLEMIMAMEYEWMYGSNSDMAKREYKAMLAAAQGAKQ